MGRRGRRPRRQSQSRPARHRRSSQRRATRLAYTAPACDPLHSLAGARSHATLMSMDILSHWLPGIGAWAGGMFFLVGLAVYLSSWVRSHELFRRLGISDYRFPVERTGPVTLVGLYRPVGDRPALAQLTGAKVVELRRVPDGPLPRRGELVRVDGEAIEPM